MVRLFKKTLLDFRKSYKQHLVFEFFYMLAISFIFVPLMAYVFTRVVRAFGSGSLLNGDVYKVALTYQGAAGSMMIGFIAVFALFVEFGVLIVIAHKKYFGQRVLTTEALLTVLAKTPKLFGFGLIQLMFFLLILMPFVDSPLISIFTSIINVPIFLNSQVYDSSTLLIIVYALAVAGAVYVVLRWIFVLHFIMIEGQSITKAIRSSFALTHRNQLKLLVCLLLLNALLLSLSFGTLSALAYLPDWLNLDILRYFTSRYSLTLSSFLTYLFTLLLVPLNIIFLTRMYYLLKRLQGTRPWDEMTIVSGGALARLERRVTTLPLRRRHKNTVFASALAVYLTLAFFLSYAINDSLIYVKWDVLVAAHRGDKLHAPENSMSAIQSAIDKGADAIEIDVQLSKDGVVVLNHDNTLSRVAGVPQRVDELTFEELQRLDIGQLFEEYAGERIPALAEVLPAVKDQARLIIEIKPYGPGDELAGKVVELINAFEMADQCYIQSFDSQILREVRLRDPDIKVGQILFLAAGDLSSLDVDFYTVEQVMLSERLIDRAHKNGREVWVWTVNTERNLREVLKYKIDGIITDYPERVKTMVDIDV
ncbi:glycerophosphodiester phosphodiesterase [Paenibacillus sp. IB182496]|uniref:Glycerophosphodiester phosphodiesterase n=1 Tax=Paenibacillus sabuli TaxID=2772509 RepID=A0A927BT56_9BACL|nr:glycerophosphodiester phosphodiesterase [Paenibacillus sabuli]